MKRIISLFLLTCLILTGCGKSKSSEKDQDQLEYEERLEELINVLEEENEMDGDRVILSEAGIRKNLDEYIKSIDLTCSKYGDSVDYEEISFKHNNKSKNYEFSFRYNINNEIVYLNINLRDTGEFASSEVIYKFNDSLSKEGYNAFTIPALVIAKLQKGMAASRDMEHDATKLISIKSANEKVYKEESWNGLGEYILKFNYDPIDEKEIYVSYAKN